MQTVTLDPRLMADSYLMGHIEETAVLLMRNASYPWLVLVPNTEESELHRLAPVEQGVLMRQASELAELIENWRPVDKMNIASIGNKVTQLHLHVVGRHRDDPSWPGVVWGAGAGAQYRQADVAELGEKMQQALGAHFRLQRSGWP